VKKPVPSKLEQCWTPGPIANSRFTEEEMAKIRFGNMEGMAQALKKLAPGWTCRDCGDFMDPGFKEEALGRKNVLLTHPFDHGIPCVLERKIQVREGMKLNLTVGHHPQGDWLLIVKADETELARQTIGGDQAWQDITIQLSQFAGKEVQLQLLGL